MAIDLYNYEAYLLDFFEEKLSAGQVAELKAFLLAHPELQIDLNDSSFPVIEPSADTFSTFSLRKDLPGEDEKRALEYVEGLMGTDEEIKFSKVIAENAGMRELVQRYQATRLSPDEEQLDRAVLMIDEPTLREIQVLEYREGLMNARQQLEFERLLERDADLSHLNKQFASCKIVADHSVVFEDKENLMRAPRVISLRATVLRAAASILLIAMLTVLLWKTEGDTGSHTASNVRSAQSTSTPEAEISQPMPPAATISNAPVAPVVGKNNIAGKNEPKQPPIIKKPVQLTIPVTEKEQQIAELEKDERVEEDHHNDLSQNAAPSQSLAASANRDSISGTVVYGLDNLAIEDESANAERHGFWEKVARVAKQMGKLGLKGVEANTGNNSVTLSLNELSVEKKYARL